jgi:hypothetical protein
LIYGLKDRVWPDFACHFTLYLGDASHFSAPREDHAWFSIDQSLEVAQRSPTNFSPSLKVLSESARSDPSSFLLLNWPSLGLFRASLILDLTRVLYGDPCRSCLLEVSK